MQGEHQAPPDEPCGRGETALAGGRGKPGDATRLRRRPRVSAVVLWRERIQWAMQAAGGECTAPIAEEIVAILEERGYQFVREPGTGVTLDRSPGDWLSILDKAVRRVGAHRFRVVPIHFAESDSPETVLHSTIIAEPVWVGDDPGEAKRVAEGVAADYLWGVAVVDLVARTIDWGHEVEPIPEPDMQALRKADAFRGYRREGV